MHSEFLIHAADVEGLCQGIDEELVKSKHPFLIATLNACFPACSSDLGEWTTIPTTYAGGAKDLSDLLRVDELSQGKVDLTYGRWAYLLKFRNVLLIQHA